MKGVKENGWRQTEGNVPPHPRAEQKQQLGRRFLSCTFFKQEMSISALELLPVQVFAVLHVEQHGRDELVHVLRLPDDGLELIVDRLPDHALQAFDPSHTDPDVSNESREQGLAGRPTATADLQSQKLTRRP